MLIIAITGLAFMMLLIILAVFYFVTIYNGLITVSRTIDKAWANIDVLLKQRHDEIPKLISACESYMTYEKETLEKITAARISCIQAKNIGESSQSESDLSKSLKTLFAVAENYPDLKSNQIFLQFQGRISYLESQIADRREFYNDSVNIYNIRINQIPDLFIAKPLNMKDKELFKVIEEDKNDVDIKIKLPGQI